MIQRSPGLSSLLLILLATGCTHKAPRPGPDAMPAAESPVYRPHRALEQGGAFEQPEELEPQVAFWRQVYASWGLGQAAIHDDRHLDVVYEVVAIPGEVGASLSPGQREWLKERREGWKGRLADLESKLMSGQLLSRGDRDLLDTLGGPSRLTGAAERVRHQRGQRERFRRGLEISQRYEQHFRRIFRNAGLPEDLAYLPHVESSFQATARSSAGAAGIWQFTRAAAKKYMTVSEAVDERLDPVAATHGAARYLRDAYDRLGSWPLALTSYNHGMNGMARAKSLFGDDLARIIAHYQHPQFGFASRNFYCEFLAAREIAKQPQRFFGKGAPTARRATSAHDPL